MTHYYMLQKDAAHAVKQATRLAVQMGHIQADGEHLLVCLMAETGNLSPMQQQTAQNILSARFMVCGKKGAARLSPKIAGLLCSLAQNGADKCDNGKISAKLLLEKLLQSDIEVAEMYSELTSSPPLICPPPQPRPEPKIAPGAHIKGLEKYAKNLTVLAAKGMLEPCYGRNAEIERVIRTLNRRTKNNPCLIGEPGVGKTAVVEGLAMMMAEGKVPPALKNKQLYCLDLPSVVAGTKYRGDFEDRVRTILDEAANGKGVILFVDEVHTLIGAGAAEGAIDAANILKPVLARAGVQLIGATTMQEYRRCIEKDAALERRFQQIMVEEPEKSKALDILIRLRPRYETFHSVLISDDALKAAVDYSVRYLPERYLPDKAIDLLDDTAAGKALKLCEKEDEKACIAQIKVTAQDIAETVSRWTGIPVQHLTADEKTRLAQLEANLNKTVIGQQKAVKAVAYAIVRAKLGLAPQGRPMASFLFFGPTGVGKTHLAKQLAQNLFGSEKLLYRFDMSEYSESSAVSKLIGAPPGYVGHDEPGRLTETVRRHPFCILLFDEMEKAANEVYRLLLQILEEGCLTDAQGRKVDFSNSIIISTANACCGENLAIVGFSGNDNNKKTAVLPKEIEKLFAPELLARFDETVQFERLQKCELMQIASRFLMQLAQRLSVQKISMTYTPTVCEVLTQSTGEKYGARPLRRTVQRMVEDVLCFDIINGNIKAGDTVMLAAENGSITAAVMPNKKQILTAVSQ